MENIEENLQWLRDNKDAKLINNKYYGLFEAVGIVYDILEGYSEIVAIRERQTAEQNEQDDKTTKNEITAEDFICESNYDKAKQLWDTYLLFGAKGLLISSRVRDEVEQYIDAVKQGIECYEKKVRLQPINAVMQNAYQFYQDNLKKIEKTVVSNKLYNEIQDWLNLINEYKTDEELEVKENKDYVKMTAAFKKTMTRKMARRSKKKSGSKLKDFMYWHKFATAGIIMSLLFILFTIGFCLAARTVVGSDFLVCKFSEYSGLLKFYYIFELVFLAATLIVILIGTVIFSKEEFDSCILADVFFMIAPIVLMGISSLMLAFMPSGEIIGFHFTIAGITTNIVYWAIAILFLSSVIVGICALVQIFGTTTSINFVNPVATLFTNIAVALISAGCLLLPKYVFHFNVFW